MTSRQPTWFLTALGFAESSYTPAQLTGSCVTVEDGDCEGDVVMRVNVGERKGEGLNVGRFSVESVAGLSDGLNLSPPSDGGVVLTDRTVVTLIEKQIRALPEATAVLNATGKKAGCWAWWAFPTSMPGASEPGTKTRVTAATAPQLVAHADPVWRQCLETVAALVASDGKLVLPEIDHGRVDHFVQFWAQHECTPQWLHAVLASLQVYCNRSRDPPSAVNSGAGLTKLTFKNVTANVETIHRQYASADAAEIVVIQAASQFNCLEMVGPRVTPGDGIEGYFRDQTQGPACAIACPNGTYYRNYLINGTGQWQKGTQINTLGAVGAAVGNESEDMWVMSNGYCMPDGGSKFKELGERIRSDDSFREELVAKIEVGVNWNVPIAGDEDRNVCQIWASACPVQYCKHIRSSDWAPLGKVVLDGMYEATLGVAARLSRERGGGRVKVFLTLVGGGAFGNSMTWIHDAIERAVLKYRGENLEVYLVHYSPVAKGSNQDKFEKELKRKLGKARG